MKADAMTKQRAGEPAWEIWLFAVVFVSVFFAFAQSQAGASPSPSGLASRAAVSAR